MSTLKQCPFCGGNPFIRRAWYDLYDTFMYCVCCAQCGSKTRLMPKEQMATNKWNERVEEKNATN